MRHAEHNPDRLTFGPVYIHDPDMYLKCFLRPLAHACGLCLVLSTTLHAQKNWQLRSPEGGTPGAGAEAAYELLKHLTPQPVIVAVIDVGTDIGHEDLKDVIWTNPREIPDNGKDDDGNGYTDDIHGWNFLGGPGGDLVYEATEETRRYQDYRRRIAGWDTARLTPEQQEVYQTYKKWARKYRKEQATRVKDAETMARVSRMNRQLHWKLLFRIAGGRGVSGQLKEAEEMARRQLTWNTLDADSARRALVGDDPQDPSKRHYGNNHVIGPEASHGTHTAGIVGAIRHNRKGPDGVAAPVRLMVLRAVPWGDERDKDVANAIRYAADNGARVINMSFGKYASPHKAVVDSAVQYALSKDVLLVHGAGNEARNTDSVAVFPNPKLGNGTIATNWIEVGASSAKEGRKLTASFSNYGRRSVDLFAPGVDIYSCLPGNRYGNQSGTSMAAPVVAGVAALIRAYFPSLTAQQVKEVLMKTVQHYEEEVRVPGKPDTTARLEDLCVSGGIVNAEAAVRSLLTSQVP